MDYLAEHRQLLEAAASGTLPERIDESGSMSVAVVRELVEAGLLQALDASSMDGAEYLDPRITVAGREYLNELDQRQSEASISGKARRLGLRLLDGLLGIAVGLLIAWGSKLL